MTTNSIPDDPPRIHLRNWLLANGDPLRDLSLFDCGFSEQTQNAECGTLKEQHGALTTEPSAQTPGPPTVGFQAGYQAAQTDSAFSVQPSAFKRRMAHLVTPSATLRELLTRCLRTLDLTIADASDAPDLVLLDLAAPDALAHCRTWREQHPDLPIVVLTPLVSDHMSAWEAGANAVLPIPFDVLDLRDLIRVLLGDGISDRITRINRIGERNG